MWGRVWAGEEISHQILDSSAWRWRWGSFSAPPPPPPFHLKLYSKGQQAGRPCKPPRRQSVVSNKGFSFGLMYKLFTGFPKMKKENNVTENTRCEILWAQSSPQDNGL